MRVDAAVRLGQALVELGLGDDVRRGGVRAGHRRGSRVGCGGVREALVGELRDARQEVAAGGAARDGSAAGAAGREALGDAGQRLGELARDHPELVRAALGDLRQRLQVLVRQELVVRVAGVDGVEHRGDGLCLTLGAEDLGLRVTLGREDGGLPLPLGLEDLGLLRALGLQDRRTTAPFGAQLLFHRVLDRHGRLDGLELDAADADAPLAGRLVEHDAELAVDVVSAGQRLFEVEATDDVAERGGRELLDRTEVVRDLVRRRTGVGDLEVDDRVDRDDEVVLGDHRLRREGHDLLAHVEQRPEPVDERHQEVQPRVEGLVVLPEAFDDARGRLRHDPDRAGQDDDHEDDDDQDEDEQSDRPG